MKRKIVVAKRGESMKCAWDKNEDALRVAWLMQLQEEFEDICYQYDQPLCQPVFELSDSRTHLGLWDGKYRRLVLSLHLIRSYSWQVTLQVLKHEMAHQLCSEIFAAPNEGHGALFRKACAMLGLKGRFCRARSDMAESLETIESASSPQTEQGRRILAKVEKLLALAGSDNEHEAALAMQRAGELLGRHNLEMPTAHETQDYQRLTIHTGRQRMPAYLHGVSALLQDFFFVKVVCSSLYDPRKDVRLKTIELFGRPENVAVAEYCYTFLLHKLETLWQDNRHRFPRGGQRARNSYFHGVLAGFRQKMAATVEADAEPGAQVEKKSCSALVVAEDRGLQDFVAFNYPRLTQARGRKVRVHPEAYREAVATGKKLVLHRAVEGASSDSGVLE